MKISVTPLLLCGLAGLFAGPALATDAPAAKPSPVVNEGLWVMRDAESGELRMPTPDEMAAMNPPAARSARRSAPAEASVVEHRGGMSSVRLGKEQLLQLNAGTDASGQLQTTHQDPSTVQSAVAATE